MNQQIFTDQLGNQIQISSPPQRIISLVPSQTELLHDLGLEDRVTGITKFCVHPEHWKRTKTIIGGTKKFDFSIIKSLNPDLIIGNKEENYQEGIEELRKQYPVWTSDIVTLDDALVMIKNVGVITNTEDKASKISSDIKNLFLNIQRVRTYRTLYLIWKKPWMAAGHDTFIHELMIIAGFQNCLDQEKRYPELISEQIKQFNPELIMLSSEPYPFTQKHIHELAQLCPNSKIVLVDGEMFSWYGSRLLKFPNYLESLRIALS